MGFGLELDLYMWATWESLETKCLEVASCAGLCPPMPLSHTIDAAHKYVAAAHNALFVLLLKLIWSKHTHLMRSLSNESNFLLFFSNLFLRFIFPSQSKIPFRSLTFWALVQLNLCPHDHHLFQIQWYILLICTSPNSQLL